jgi:2-hydroxychromene-2-carboxylate isomerase
MGIVISLTERRRARARSSSTRHKRAVFFFDLSDPGTYLAAERVDRLAAAVTWQPAIAPTLATLAAEDAAERAATLRLPLVWPVDHPAPVPRAMRAASHAAEQGRGAAFVLAASRLAFCGGFDLDDPETLAEAAAAAGVDLGDCLRAAADERRDAAMERAGAFLVAHGADAMPAVQIGRVLFAGEARLADAAAALRDGTFARSRARGRD